MSSLLGFGIISVLFVIVIVQIARVAELSKRIRGDKESQSMTNNRQANLMVAFMVAFLVFCVASAAYYKNYMLGYGPHEAASVHGKLIDGLFNETLFFTGIVFFLTQIALFYFAWKFKEEDGRKSLFISHDNKLEVIWTAIPAVVMAVLVIGGLNVWNEVMADVNDDEDFIEIEATGYQFAWHIRYPGPDGLIGTKNYKLISGNNPVGQDWNDMKNLDDTHPTEIVLPVGKQVRVRITSRDVLHNFYLPHFRVKMDAVPGMPTYFVFTPEETTEEYRQKLKEYKEYQIPADPTEPDGPQKWEAFEFELACAELCGKGHYSMKRIVKIVEQEEYDKWLMDQPSYYLSSIRNTDDDPYKGKTLSIDEKVSEPAAEVEEAVTSEQNEVDDQSISAVIN